VLGELFEARALRELLVEAIRYGERPDVRARLFVRIDGAIDEGHIRALFAERKLAAEGMTAADVASVRAEMERAEACRVQPRFIRAFFSEAFAASAVRSGRGSRDASRSPMCRGAPLQKPGRVA
jgi:hypothetical protein